MFPDRIKIQVEHKKEIVHLGLRVTDNHVQNIIMPIREMIKICMPSTKKYEWLVDDMYWQFYRKTDYIKLFFKTESVDFHWRFSHEEWDAIVKDLLVKVKDS